MADQVATEGTARRLVVVARAAAHAVAHAAARARVVTIVIDVDKIHVAHVVLRKNIIVQVQVHRDVTLALALALVHLYRIVRHGAGRR